MAFTLESLLQSGRVAFVLTEVQQGVIGDLAPWPQLADASNKVGLVKNAARIAQVARAHGAPVIHCTAENLPNRFGGNVNSKLFSTARKVTEEGSKNPRYFKPMPEVWQDGDILLPRFHGVSAMTGTPLDSVLRNHGVTTIIISGVSLCFCVMNTTFDAVNRSYQVIVPQDAAAGFPEEYAKGVVINTLSMLATITTTDDLVKAWSSIPA